MTLIPITYEVVGHPFKHHKVFIEKRGPYSWVCTTGEGSCLNNEGDFEYEPLPSGRDEGFLKRTRFVSPAAALENFERWLPTFGARW